jgi:hypothetical protein
MYISFWIKINNIKIFKYINLSIILIYINNMPRTKGAKNKNINTAKNKNIININVNSSKSKRGRPRKTTANTNTQNRPPTSGGGISMAPPQVIITQPPADNSNNNSLLSSFITSKMLNETMNLNRTVEPTRIEPTIVEPPRPEPSYFAARESIIPKLPDTPKQRDIVQKVNYLLYQDEVIYNKM